MSRIDIAEFREPNPVWLGLNDSNMLAGVISTDYDPIPQTGDFVREQLRIHLRGELPILRQAVRQLEALVVQANRYEALRVGNPVFLRLLTNEADGYWYARIFSVTLTGQERHLASHDLGAITLMLSFERENHFESDTVLLSLSNSGGGPTSGALTVLNHKDDTPGHANYLDINATQFDSDLPARLRLEVINSGAQLGDIYAGVIAWPVNEFAGSLSLQAENATPATVVNNAAASGGKVSSLSWSGSGWTVLTTWTLSSETLKKYDCNRFLPVLRWLGGLTGGPVQLRLSVSVEGSLVYQGAPSLVANGATFANLDSLRLPLGRTPMQVPLAPYSLTLSAQCSTAGAHSLALDDLNLMPQESACLFKSISGLSNGALLVDDSSTGYSATISNNLELRTHTRIGSALEIVPGRLNRLVFFMTSPTGTAPIDLAMLVRVTARKRRRVL